VVDQETAQVVDRETAHVVDRETAHVVAPVEFLVGTLLAISMPGSAGEHRDGSVCPGYLYHLGS